MARRQDDEELDRILVDLNRLDPEGEDLEGVAEGAVDIDSPFVTVLGGLEYRLFVQLLGTELLVRGEVWQDFDLVCSRCNEVFGYRVTVPDFTTSIEVDEKTQIVDLTDEAREGIILNLPSFPVCREECKGLCPKCGKNLNEGPCACEKESGDSRWGALDALKL